MDIITGNEPAMPHPVHEGRSGLSIRQHFASMAMSGILTNSEMVNDKDDRSVEWTAVASVKFADALIAELNKEK